MGISAYNIGTKFHADGTVRFFPGNTIISFMDQGAPAFAEFRRIRHMLAQCSAARCLVMLPDASIHMTVIEGVCDQWRRKELWTSLLPLDCPLTAVDDLFEARLREVRPLEATRMRMVGLGGRSGISISLSPAGEQDARQLRRYRDEVGRAMGLRFPNHDSYGFHISIAYYIHDPTPGEAAELAEAKRQAEAYIQARDIVFPLQPPTLTFFDNMFAFSPQRIPRRE